MTFSPWEDAPRIQGEPKNPSRTQIERGYLPIPRTGPGLRGNDAVESKNLPSEGQCS